MEARAGASPASPANGSVSIIVESYNLAEGGESERMFRSFRAASEMASRLNGEVLLADSSGNAELREVMARDFPTITHVEAPGQGYEGSKMKAVARASGDFILFLDGDCIPDAPDWAEKHLTALREPQTAATAGFTRYDHGFLAAVSSVMDFGVLLPAARDTVECYTSNNCGFKRDTLTSCPIPEGPLRCRCFYHAQLLKRRGTPVRMVGAAKVRHEVQPFFAERYRRGYDIVAACWLDPALPEARLLRLGPLAAPLLYAGLLVQDLKRVWTGRRDLGLTRRQSLAAMPLFPVLRIVDLAGMLRALIIPKSRRRAAVQIDH
ncbi:MAG: glycosyltransferase [Solirubrobacterales bacterium]